LEIGVSGLIREIREIRGERPSGNVAVVLIERAVASPPDLAVGKSPDRRSGRILALPYPPLEQREGFPFPFPLGSIGRETGKGSLRW